MFQFILAYGNVKDGMEFVGPFATISEAIDYAEKDNLGKDWWVFELQKPDGNH